MALDHLLARGRAAAERLMTDACVIRRKTGEETDPFSGVVTPVYTTLYTGPCRVQRVASATGIEAGEGLRLMLRLELHVPVSVVDLKPGDEAELTVSGDPELLGRTLIVRDLSHKTHATQRRLGVEERTS